jgi:hypothetical protein
MLNALRFTSDIYFSFKKVLSSTTYLLGFFSYYLWFYYNPNRISLLIKNCTLGLIIFFLNILISTIFKIGDNSIGYDINNSVIFLGGLTIFNLYPIVFLLLFVQLNKSIKYFLDLRIVLFLIFIIIFFLIGKRTYIYLSFVGMIIVFNKSIGKFFIYSIISLSIILFTNLDKIIIDNFFTARETQLTRSITEEGRILEFFVYKEEIIDRAPLENIVFGTEVFNSDSKFFNVSKLIDDDKRTLHSDYSNIVFGVGLLGILTYFIFLASLYKTWRKIKLKNPFYRKDYSVVFISMLVVLVLNGLSDGWLDFNNRSFPFLLLGATLGMINHKTAKKPTLEKPDESI